MRTPGETAALLLGIPAPRRRAAILARAAFTVALLALILAWLPTGELFGAMSRVGLGLWSSVVLGFGVGHGVAALKWRVLLRSAGLRPGVGDVLPAHGAGLFANLCLPSLVGGDVVRGGVLARRHSPLEAIAVAGVADRVIDTAALVALAALGALLVPGTLDSRSAAVLGSAALGLPAAVLGGLVVLRRVDSRRLPGAAGRVAGKVRGALDALLAQPRAALGALGLSLAIQAAFVMLNVALGDAVGIHVPVAVWLLAWPLAKLTALLPISLGGIGVREVALAALLAPFAVDATLAVAQALLWETVLVGFGLLAGAASLGAVRWTRPAAGAQAGGPE